MYQVLERQQRAKHKETGKQEKFQENKKSFYFTQSHKKYIKEYNRIYLF